jgi:hypothetical protein
MPLELVAPLYKEFVLEKTDEKYGVEGEGTSVLIKQAAQREHEQRQDLFSTLERKFKQLAPDEVSLVSRFSLEELKRQEVWLTMVECNIKDEKGKALFPSRKEKGGHSVLAMTKQQFYDAWGKLPPDVANEIHDKVLEVNILWTGFEGEGL